MRVGFSRPDSGLRPRGEQQIQCAYSGCNRKMSVVDARFLGRSIRLNFVGTSHSDFEDSQPSTNQGADLAPETVLNLRWRRLEYFAEHPFLGRVTVRLRESPESIGKVISAADPALDLTEFGLDRATVASSAAFFPAVSENKLYMEFSVPRFGLTFTSREPITNVAVISQIPPEGSEFAMREAVKFRSNRRWLPVELSLEECRVSMGILAGIDVSVGDLRRVGRSTEIPLTLRNTTDESKVRVGVMSESDCGVVCSPDRMFVSLDRSPSTVRIMADLRHARAPGKLFLQIILAEPYRSVGYNNVAFDLEELLTGSADPDLPVLT